MARMIDADELPITSVGICDAMGNTYGCGDVVFADDIKNAPTVDTEPVRHANRIVVRSADRNKYGFYTYQVKCSECGDTEAYKNYCPNCGAKFISSNFVDEERENENAGG